MDFQDKDKGKYRGLKVVCFEEIGFNKIGKAVLGIDLSSSRKSGLAVLNGREVDTYLKKEDNEFLELANDKNVNLVSIDSPLSKPDEGIMRECEKELRRRRIGVYPCFIDSMKKLTKRGIRLKNNFEKKGYRVIESYPGAAQDIIGIPRKQDSEQKLREGLLNFGLHGIEEEITHDELDAITSALVGYFYLSGNFENLNPLLIPRWGPDRFG